MNGNSYYNMHSIPASRSIVEKMLHVPQTLENIITAASSLDDDPVAIGSNFPVHARDLKMTKHWYHFQAVFTT